MPETAAWFDAAMRNLLTRRPPGQPYNLAKQSQWGTRARTAVELWKPYARQGPLLVADLGAGNALVRRLIDRPAVSYIAYDLLPQHDAINPWDLRDGLPAPEVDVAFMLGVLEYIDADTPLITALGSYTRQVVCSYNSVDAVPDRRQRTSLGWQRHETAQATTDEFQAAGFTLEAETVVADESTRVWLWSRDHS